jgi:hypothetical protein
MQIQTRQVVAECVSARRKRDVAYDRLDLAEAYLWNDRLIYWIGVLSDAMAADGVDIEAVREMMGETE